MNRWTKLWLRMTGGRLSCGCHWHPRFGVVIMMGCQRHD